MITSQYFDTDELTGAVETFHYDDADDTFTISRAEDVEPLLNMNKRLQNAAGDGWKGDLHRVASIPNVLLPELEKLGIMTAGGRILDSTKLRAWLNDSANCHFRTRLGRV